MALVSISTQQQPLRAYRSSSRLDEQTSPAICPFPETHCQGMFEEGPQCSAGPSSLRQQRIDLFAVDAGLQKIEAAVRQHFARCIMHRALCDPGQRRPKR